MVHVTFVDWEGSRRTVEIAAGLSVMEGGLRHRIAGLDGDCGGACACATCHVHVAPEWVERLPPPSALELAMLKMAVAPDATSRLACQIKLRPELDGLTVRTPKSQYEDDGLGEFRASLIHVKTQK